MTKRRNRKGGSSRFAEADTAELPPLGRLNDALPAEEDRRRSDDIVFRRNRPRPWPEETADAPAPLPEAPVAQPPPPAPSMDFTVEDGERLAAEMATPEPADVHETPSTPDMEFTPEEIASVNAPDAEPLPDASADVRGPPPLAEEDEPLPDAGAGAPVAGARAPLTSEGGSGLEEPMPGHPDSDREYNARDERAAASQRSARSDPEAEMRDAQNRQMWALIFGGAMGGLGSLASNGRWDNEAYLQNIARIAGLPVENLKERLAIRAQQEDQRNAQERQFQGDTERLDARGQAMADRARTEQTTQRTTRERATAMREELFARMAPSLGTPELQERYRQQLAGISDDALIAGVAEGRVRQAEALQRGDQAQTGREDLARQREQATLGRLGAIYEHKLELWQQTHRRRAGAGGGAAAPTPSSVLTADDVRRINPNATDDEANALIDRLARTRMSRLSAADQIAARGMASGGVAEARVQGRERAEDVDQDVILDPHDGGPPILSGTGVPIAAGLRGRIAADIADVRSGIENIHHALEIGSDMGPADLLDRERMSRLGPRLARIQAAIAAAKHIGIVQPSEVPAVNAVIGAPDTVGTAFINQTFGTFRAGMGELARVLEESTAASMRSLGVPDEDAARVRAFVHGRERSHYRRTHPQAAPAAQPAAQAPAQPATRRVTVTGPRGSREAVLTEDQIRQAQAAGMTVR